MNKALFLDLDHTIVKPRSGERFPRDKDDWEFLPKILHKINHYYNKDHIPIVVTNQGGIEAGYVDFNDFIDKADTVTRKIASYLDYHDGRIPYYFCQYVDDSNYYRKPNPGMAIKAALDFELNLYASLMVGDMDSDKKFAKSAGIGTFYYISNFLY